MIFEITWPWPGKYIICYDLENNKSEIAIEKIENVYDDITFVKLVENIYKKIKGITQKDGFCYFWAISPPPPPEPINWPFIGMCMGAGVCFLFLVFLIYLCATSIKSKEDCKDCMRQLCAEI